MTSAAFVRLKRAGALHMAAILLESDDVDSVVADDSRGRTAGRREATASNTSPYAATSADEWLVLASTRASQSNSTARRSRAAIHQPAGFHGIRTTASAAA